MINTTASEYRDVSVPVIGPPKGQEPGTKAASQSLVFPYLAQLSKIQIYFITQPGWLLQARAGSLLSCVTVTD